MISSARHRRSGDLVGVVHDSVFGVVSDAVAESVSDTVDDTL